MFMFGAINYIKLKNYFLIVNCLASQEATPSNSEQDANREATDVTWMIVAIVFLVVAILLTITSIALGTILCLTRKSVKSLKDSKLAPHKGKCATPFNDFMHVYTVTHIYIH